jgi:hypothetical protein
VFDDGLCRSVVEPQRDPGAHASPSRKRLLDYGVTVQTLDDDARTETPPPAVDSRVATLPPASAMRMATPPHASNTSMATPPPASDARAQGSVGDVGASTCPRVIYIDPISVMPGGMDDRAQIEQGPNYPG